MRCKRLTILSVGGALLTVFVTACTTTPENDERDLGIPGAVVRTDQDVTIRHPDGWTIHAPVGSVPSDEAGESGEMLFTIELGNLATLAMPATPPPGWTIVGDPADLGPSWFTLAIPVTASLPISPSLDLGAVHACVFAYDGATASWVARGGEVQQGLVSVDAVRLGPHLIMTRPLSAQGWGALAFDAIAGYQFVVSIVDVRLGYFPEDAAFDPAWCHARVRSLEEHGTPAGARSYLPVPQGIYHLALGVYRTMDGAYMGYGETTVTVGQPHWDWTNPDHAIYANAVSVGDLTRWTDPSRLRPGAQPGVPSPTPPVGIGAINVRLEWTAEADLDLWVMDPCGNRLYDGAPEAVCGDAVGRLDMENQCARFVVGKPENAFWAAPARGLYTVYLDYYADCGGAGRIPYTLRWMTRGVVHVLRGTVMPPEWEGVVGDEVKLVEFRY